MYWERSFRRISHFKSVFDLALFYAGIGHHVPYTCVWCLLSRYFRLINAVKSDVVPSIDQDEDSATVEVNTLMFDILICRTTSTTI
jgi:hypothetical protein